MVLAVVVELHPQAVEEKKRRTVLLRRNTSGRT